MYQLIYSNQSNLLPYSNQGKVQNIYYIRSANTNDIIAYVRSGRDIFVCKYVEDRWQLDWNATIFSKPGEYSLTRYPWLLKDNLLHSKDIIVLKHPDGIRFYQIEYAKSRLKLLKEDRHFHDVYSYTLLLGSFFPNTDHVGLMTRDLGREIKFYAATSDSFLPNVSYPLFPFQNKLSLTPAWHSNDTDFFVAKILHNGQEAVGLRTTKGLEFYQFNVDYSLNLIVQTTLMAKSQENLQDRILFADLTHQKYQDILHLNDSGLFVYKYNNKQDYIFLNHNTEFSYSHGWLPQYSDSVRLIDINNDNRDDLLFTGPQGINVLTFDSTHNIWKPLLVHEQLSRLQLYATVIGSLEAMPPIILQPVIFTQDTEGNVQWAKAVHKSPITTTSAEPTATTVTAPTSQYSNQTSHVIPEQIVHTNLPKKPILRWAEQWGDNFIKHPVDVVSGQVNINIPLIDSSSFTGWGLQLTLSYNSFATTSDLLGIGWSLPLVQEFIFVDYQRSINPEDARYYLMVQGRVHLLKPIRKSKGVESFQIAVQSEPEDTESITINYYPEKQRWIIEGTWERTIYGKANHNMAKDALQWSLSWPNWRGPGRDKEELQPVIIAWYLNTRFDKKNQNALYYYYEIDNTDKDVGKSYTSAIRLKTICDNQELKLTLDYAPKEKYEYTVPSLIDDQGFITFPVPLIQTHYLRGYKFITSVCSQELKFNYQTNKEIRLLTAIKQQLPSHSDPLLEFTYERLSERQALKSCKLIPRGLTVTFNYESVTPPIPLIASNNTFSYPSKENSKIGYGPNYAIIAYRDFNPISDKVTLLIMNREMTKIVTNLVAEAKLINVSTIKDFTLHAYQDSLMVFIEADHVKALYIFICNKNTWAAEPSVFSFNNKTLVRFSETVIAATEPVEKTVTLLDHDSQSRWNKQTLSIPRAMTFFTLYKRLVVGYDDNQLWLFHYDSKSGWQSKVLASNVPGLASMSRKTLASFDFTSEILQQLSTALDHNGLQILNNFILLSALHDENGQLFSHIHLYLLDEQHNIIKNQLFNIKRENIYQFNRQSESQDGKIIYHLGYIKEDGVYKVRVKNISGKKIEEIRNKNRRQDAIEEQTAHVNNDEEFKKNAKKYFFLNWNLYPIQISPYGVYCGNDTLLRTTGTGWEQVSLPIFTIRLGKDFVLDATNDTKSLTLYMQDNDQNKQGQPLKVLKLYSPDQLINRYPAYIAYHPDPNSVNVLTFVDDKTVGQFHTFINEQLVPESDWQNLITISNASAIKEYKVRPVSTLVLPKRQLFVSQMMLNDNETQRLTGYQHSFSKNQQKLRSTEKVTMIPGDKKNLYGWYETLRSYDVSNGNFTESEHWFNANGEEVLMPPKEKSDKQDANTLNTSTESNEELLLDSTAKWVITDVSPYKLADEMIGYYGFESYENNQIGASGSNKVLKFWHFNRAKIIKGRFAFTGENYLQLNPSTAEASSFFEGALQPRDQETTYLAACWIRCGTVLTLNRPVSYFRAIIGTEGQEIIGLLSEAKYQRGDWFYLEIIIDFQVVKQIYKNYVSYTATTNTTMPIVDKAQFNITLRVEAPSDQTVDLDHIRFSPLNHDFQATVYNPKPGTSAAIIQANGLVIRTIYNRLQQEIASIDAEGQMRQFCSSSKTGKLVPSPEGLKVDAKPNILLFEPENGFYETFDPFALHNRWKVDNPDAWNIAPGQLWHIQSGKHQIKPVSYLFDNTSAAIRFYFALQETQSSLSFVWKETAKLEFIYQPDDSISLVLPNGHIIAPLPQAGELIVMLDGNLWLWLDGVLLIDQELTVSKARTNEFIPWSFFSLQVQGQVLIEDMVVMNRPQLKVEYYNAFDEKTQVIQLVNAKSSLVTETLYDELGRGAIITKSTQINRIAGRPLLAYHSDFVTNKLYSNPQSVWRTGKLQGVIDKFNPEDQGVAYIRTEYAPNPLNEVAAQGLPGSKFSINGPYVTKLIQNSHVAFLDNLFPNSHGYRQKVENPPNGSRKVTIFDKNNNQVAIYVRVPRYNHLLSTYEYDNENRLIKILPPLYHEKVNTDMKLTPWQSGEDHLSVKEKYWQQALATYFIYDRHGQVLRKITPDSGVTEYIYNTESQLRFMVSLDSSNKPQKIVYFNYDPNGQLSSSGYFNEPFSISELKQYVESHFLPNIRRYQQCEYADGHHDPLLRGRVKYCITYNEGEPIIDKLRFNSQEQIITKSTITLSGQPDSVQLNDLKKQYSNNNVKMLTYPITVNGKALQIIYSYNGLGQLIALGTKDQPNNYAIFSYHATGQLASEEYFSNTQNGFIRNYHYNSPGFLDQISDSFLTEDISYTEHGYGQAGYGDGIIMQTAFNATWPVNADGRWFQIQEFDLPSNYSSLCIKALERTGYLTAFKKPNKLYVRNVENSIPLVCRGSTGRSIAKLIAEKQTPNSYGHRYAYGNHQELVKAKYFTDDTVLFIEPLQSDSFAKTISSLTYEQSQHIWQILVDAGYIITNQQRSDAANASGTAGKSFLRSTELYKDLKSLNKAYVLYAQPIEGLILTAISKQRTISLTDFEIAFLDWQGIDHATSIVIKNQQKDIAQEIGKMLLSKGYLPTHITNFIGTLDKYFTTILHQYISLIPNIVQVLSQHFAYSLGESAFDVESLDIDANGNHGLFYTGFNRYELTYRNTTNQIESIKLDWPDTLPEQSFAVRHDNEGNVIQALHKGIKSIRYHPVSQRTTHIQLTDGRTFRFYYDAQGERILKRAFNAAGNITYEIHYLRDEQGRVLIDRQTTYLSKSTEEITTAYLYGPRGLLGFFRKNKFYSVFTDHAGSVRLVIESGRVVAAYDYLPYGQLMRSYGNDPQVHIRYRYTGQEWDEETGLYNYHARLYDPSIGRFYQPDPKAQYFSPYMYAGNSPISTIDPDGEFAFLLTCLALGVLGAYLGGAAANNRWNPVDWDYEDPGTWLGIGGGAIAGGLLPVGFAASVASVGVGATVGLGIGGAYLTTAASNQNWDPRQWQWERPHTWSAAFQGFGSGSGIAGGIGLAHNFAKTGNVITKFSNALGISRDITKKIFLSVSYTAGGSLAYFGGVRANNGSIAFWQWNWSSPGTLSSLIDGFDMGMGWPQNIIEIGRGLGKLSKNSLKSVNLLGRNPSKIYKLKIILKNPNHPLYKVTTSAVMAYFMGSSATGELDITRWNLASFSTYEGILNGIFFGKDTSNMLKFARRAKINQVSNSLIPMYKDNHWAGRFRNIFNDIQALRTKIEYKHLIKELFSSDKSRQSILQKLQDAPDSLKRAFENFLKGGIDKWRKGDIKPSEALKQILSQEAENKVLRTTQTQKLVEWITEEDVLIKKKQEVFPDREVEFLNCHSIARRRKRGKAGSSTSCSVPSTSGNPVPQKSNDKPKPELIEQLLDSVDPGISSRTAEKDGYISVQPRSFDKPQGFVEHFSLILQKTPTILGPSKFEFFPNFILGSLYTIPTKLLPNLKKDIFAKIENINIFSPHDDKLIPHYILKTGFKKNDQTLILKTFVADQSAKAQDIKKGTLRQTYIADNEAHIKKNLDLNSKYTTDELDEISTKLKYGINDNYKVEEHVYYIKNDHSLYVKQVPSQSKDTYDYNNNDRSSSTITEFHKIEYINDMDLKEHLDNLCSPDIKTVESSINAISQEILKMYNTNKEVFGFNIKSEAALHGFFYGALSLNFKYRHYLDIYVERIAGKGYADLMLLSRKNNNNNKNWQAIPIVIEFKADNTPVSSAIDQAKGTGYLYNLSMRTVAEQAVIVGVSPNTPETIATSIHDIPQPTGLIDPLMRDIKDITMADENIKHNVEEEIKHLYYCISPLAFKNENHYFSRLILGELLSRTNVEELHVFKSKEALSTFVFKGKDTNRWIMLNLVESSTSTQTFKNIDNLLKQNNIALPDGVQINSLVKIDIKVNNKSKLGWSPELKIRTDSKTKHSDDPTLYFFQGIEISTNLQPIIFSTTKDYKKMGSLVRIEDFFIKANRNEALKKLSESLIPIKNMINSESDFQAVLHGIFFNKLSTNKSLKVLPEANLSKEGRIDLLICQREVEGPGIPKKEKVLVMELKYAIKNAEQELHGANLQIMKYISNLKSITDSQSVIPITLVFNKNAKVGEAIIIYEVLTGKLISHTSNTQSHRERLQELQYQLKNFENRLSSDKLDYQTFSMIKDNVDKLRGIISQSDSKTFVKEIDEIVRQIELDDLELEIDKEGDQNNDIFTDKNQINEVEKVLANLKEFIANMQHFKLVTEDNPQPNKGDSDYSDLESSPSTKKHKTDDRRKRSLSGIIEYHHTSSRNSGAANEKDTNNKYLNVAYSSASSRLQFWPIKIIKNVGITISSMLHVDWISDLTHHNKIYPPQDYMSLSHPYLPVKEQPTLNQQTAEPDLLKIGDQWIKETAMDGLLSWGILLVRKFTGYKPKSFKSLTESQETNITLDIQAFTLVDEFQKIVLKHAQNCGIASCMFDIFEHSELYYSTIQKVRGKLSRGELESIPQLLYEQLIQNNMKYMASKLNHALAYKLSAKLAEDIPNIQQQFIEYEQEWFSCKNHGEKVAFQTCSNINRANVDIPNQIISTNPKSEELFHQCTATTTTNNTKMFTNASICSDTSQ